MEAAPGQRLLQRQNGRQRLIFHHHLFRRRPASRLGLAHHQRDQLAVEENLAVGQQDFILFDPAHIVHARDVFGQQYGLNARHDPRGRRLAAHDARMGVGRANRPDLEHHPARRLVVGIDRPAADVLPRALMRQARPRVSRNRRQESRMCLLSTL